MKNGVILSIISALVFSIMVLLTKAVSLNIASSQIVFFRSFIGSIIIFILMRKKGIEFSKKGRPMLILRGLFGAFYLICYFFTISTIPLADATILVKISPFFVLLFSFLFLKEKISKQKGFLVLGALIGALIMINPFKISSFSVNSVVGVLSAVFAGAASITIRHLTKKHHSFEIVFYFLFIATFVSIPLMWNDFKVPTLFELLFLILIAVISLLGQVVLTKACTHENIAVVAVTRNIGIVFSVLWGFLFWKEIPGLYSIIGGSLIVFSCVFLTVVNNKKAVKEEKRIRA